ncbi:MAG: hypothetical protein KDK04_30300, partial [Candidatus Competibacteraceae bacterium]|nr:hypothetical protein [Candidatus Competibacteraceae bacterium]
ILLLVLSLLGCTQNVPYRTGDIAPCPTENPDNPDDACNIALIEQHEGYDLAFVEFTERGNVFDRERMAQVLAYAAELAQSESGVAAVVFVHGWKHNANGNDPNVHSFRDLLQQAAALRTADSLPAGRKLLGVYIGWRGLSLDLGFLTNASYWERKQVAHQVGKGGVTEFLLRLERTVVDPERSNKNLLLVTGHSFGGAIVLASLNEVLLERMVSAEPARQGCGAAKPGCSVCLQSRPFGHGVVLLNPAIEANEALQLKENAARMCFAPTQNRLLHVISSDADKATNKSFRMGQWLGVSLRWREAELQRRFGEHTVLLDETDLDTTTVGNYMPFRTGYLRQDDKDPTGWAYQNCVGAALGDEDCIDEPDQRNNHIPAATNEPLAFIQTDGEFIADHNDVFNAKVAGYLMAIIAEQRYKRRLAGDGDIRAEEIPAECVRENGNFNFGGCFDNYWQRFDKLDKES